jgi:large subunit ribosomal protein L18
MATKKVFTVPYRRTRTSRTDYKKRLPLLKSKLPRLVVRRSNKHMLAQLIIYREQGDVVVASAHTRELSKFGWDTSTSNIPAAYLVGLLVGAKAKDKEAIMDTGLQRTMKGSRIFAVLKGAADGGLKIAFSQEVVPTDDRIAGKHISGYAEKLKGEKEKFDKLYSRYIKNKKDPAKFQDYFEKTKEKILKV